MTAQEAAKVAAVEQKASLADLYTNRNRPTWNQNINQLNIVSKDFLDSWRKFVKYVPIFTKVHFAICSEV